MSPSGGPRAAALVDRAMVGDALAELALSAPYTHPDDLPSVIGRAAGMLGADDIVLYVADLGQQVLVPMQGRDQPNREVLDIEGTVGGRAYRTESIVPILRGDGRTQLWVPVQDSAERLGVLRMTFAGVDESVEQAAKAFTSIVGEYVVTKSRYGDALERTRRRRPLTLSAELRWALLPPLTYHSPSCTVTGLVEPSYEIAGDTFDYAVVGDMVHLAIWDAVGHGLLASRIANLLVCAYRNSRRSGGRLHEMYAELDGVVQSEFGDSLFATGVLAEIDTIDGRLRWVSAGHPAPLLLRGTQVIDELHSPPSLPLGLGDGCIQVIEEKQLQPGDTVVFFTDGVTEARSPTGEHFGLQRLAEHVSRAASAGQRPAETLRRLVASIVEHQRGVLQDDATVLLATWHGPPPEGERSQRR
ncbi:MAG: PP2C family protein-serine/threonine phosphatase [Acidimicrobiales bacterium]|nr:PP2C family protein-serine/threonine phosphatase [Acidimicrobiales bacterium]